MKRTILILSLLFISIQSFSQIKNDWLNKTSPEMDKAIEISQKNNKPILLFFTGSDWCGWCKKLVKEVFQTNEFNKWAKENVILVDVDFPRRTKLSSELENQNRQLQQMFGVRGYPTIWIVKPVKTENGQINLEKVGSTGYVRGGAQAWINNANILISK